MKIEIGGKQWDILRDDVIGASFSQLPLSESEKEHNARRQQLLDQGLKQEASSLGPGILMAFQAIGAVAEKVYRSTRYIPAEIQEKACQQAIAAGRQMTSFLDHPTIGINCSAQNWYIGLSENVAGKVEKWHFDGKRVVIERLLILDNEKGRKFADNFRGGVLKYGLSQRALGLQEPRQIVIDGERRNVLYVTDIYGIFGWDLVLLDTANAGNETELQQLADDITGGGSSVPRNNSGSNPTMPKKHIVRLTTAKGTEKKEHILIDQNDERNEDQLHEYGKGLFDTLHDMHGTFLEQYEKHKSLADQLLSTLSRLGDSFAFDPAIAQGLFDSVMTEDLALREGVELNDGLKERFAEYVMEEDFYNHTYTAMRLSKYAAWNIVYDEELSLEEKVSKLQELLTEIQDIFGAVAAAYIEGQTAYVEQMHSGDDPADPATGEPISDDTTDPTATASGDAPSSADPATGEPIGDDTTDPAVAQTAAPILDQSAINAQMEEIKRRQQKLADQERMIALKSKVNAGLASFEMGDQADFVKGQIMAQINPKTTDQEAQVLIDNFAALLETKRQEQGAEQFLADIGFGAGAAGNTTEPPQREEGRSMKYENLNDQAFPPTDDRLSGALMIADTLFAAGDYQAASPESMTPRVRSLVDTFCQKNQNALREESVYLKGHTLKDSHGAEIKDKATGRPLLDASVISNANAPATMTLLILTEAYSEFPLMDIVVLHTMNGHKQEIPIRKWRRSDGSTVFKPTWLQRKRLRKGELKPFAKGNKQYTFEELVAGTRGLASEMSNEFFRRAMDIEKGTGGNGQTMAMIIADLAQELQQDLVLEFFDLMLWGATANGASSGSRQHNGNGSDSQFYFHGTSVSTTRALVPHHSTTPIAVSVGTTSANRKTVPVLGDTDVGGGPNSDLFYYPLYSEGKIQFCDANGDAKAPVSGTNNILIEAYSNAGETSFDMDRGSTDQDKHMDALNFAVEDKAANLNEGQVSAFLFSPNLLLSAPSVATKMDQSQIYRADGRRKKYPDGEPMTAENGFEGFHGVRAGLAHYTSSLFDTKMIIISRKDAVHFGVYHPFSVSEPQEMRDSNSRLVGGKTLYGEQEDDMIMPQRETSTYVRLYN